MTADVRIALERVLASPCFKDSPQTSAFLKFIVEETLAGRGQELKGYTIATLALGRPESFDPQSDPIVRVQAGRLRQSLTDFHQSEPDLPLKIELDKGSYIPRFVRSAGSQLDLADIGLSQSSQTAAQLGSSISRILGWRSWVTASLVIAGAFLALQWGRLPSSNQAIKASQTIEGDPQLFIPHLVVRSYSGTSSENETAFIRRVSDAIARFDDMVIVQEDVSSRDNTQRRSAWAARRNMALTISILPASEGFMRVAARLTDVESGRQIWSREYEPVVAGPAGDAARLRIVQFIASTIAQPYGVIHAHVRASVVPNTQGNDSYGCLVEAFDYWLINNVAAHKRARDCLMVYVATTPQSSAAHAQLAYLHLEEFRQGYNVLPGDARGRALESARRAVQAKPTSARAHQALLAVHFARREMDEAWRSANEALELNPFDSEIMADVGSRNVQSGRYAKGLILLQQALEINLAPPTWAVSFRAIALYMLDRIDEAAPLAQSLEGSSYPPAMLAMVLTSYQSRNVQAAQKNLALLRTMHPDIAKNLNAYLDRLNFDAATIARALKSYDSAVTWIDAQENMKL